MKTIKLTLIFIISIITLISCDKTPTFKFDLEVRGTVDDPKTAIFAEFDNKVKNDTVAIPLNIGIPAYTHDVEAIEFVNKFMDKYVYNVIDTNKTNYDIHIDGFIEHKETGITFNVHKHLTNK